MISAKLTGIHRVSSPAQSIQVLGQQKSLQHICLMSTNSVAAPVKLPSLLSIHKQMWLQLFLSHSPSQELCVANLSMKSIDPRKARSNNGSLIRSVSSNLILKKEHPCIAPQFISLTRHVHTIEAHPKQIVTRSTTPDHIQNSRDDSGTSSISDIRADPPIWKPALYPNPAQEFHELAEWSLNLFWNGESPEPAAGDASATRSDCYFCLVDSTRIAWVPCYQCNMVRLMWPSQVKFHRLRSLLP